MNLVICQIPVNALHHVGTGKIFGGVGSYTTQTLFKIQRGCTWAEVLVSGVVAGLVKETYDVYRAAQ